MCVCGSHMVLLQGRRVEDCVSVCLAAGVEFATHVRPREAGRLEHHARMVEFLPQPTEEVRKSRDILTPRMRLRTCAENKSASVPGKFGVQFVL